MAQTTTTTEGDIAFSVSGSGPAIVLLPGFQSSRVGWLAPNSYPDLLPGYQIVNIDPLGHGKSTMSVNDADYSAHKVVDHVLAVLDAAVSLKDLSPLKSVGLHKLTGHRKGQWAMTVSGPWRVCFRFRDGDAYDVAIVDYHKG